MKNTMLLRLFFLFLFAFIIFLFVSQSSANPLRPWPSQIKYYNNTESSLIDRAAREWALQGLPRFVPTSNLSEADVVVNAKSPGELHIKCENDCLGYATGLGYSPSGREVGIALGLPPDILYSVALHEFGHVLGLEHETEPGCYLMSTVLRSSCGLSLSPNDQYRLKTLYPDFSY